MKTSTVFQALLIAAASLTSSTPVILPHKVFSVEFVYGNKVVVNIMDENTCQQNNPNKAQPQQFDWQHITALREHLGVNFSCRFWMKRDCKGDDGFIYGIGPTENFKAGSKLGLPPNAKPQSVQCWMVYPPEQVTKRTIVAGLPARTKM
ncbi:hypothetical protein FKW77_009068 [Venturia effusa]|uniref:Ecp2 effector protein domain-containing protein n=1 Tax=Venturia effusa TaxID=50376 RepID=A0A517KX68_9PEZI|nr:hypothetical protein FKW77_009068 [Venturia effusa]